MCLASASHETRCHHGIASEFGTQKHLNASLQFLKLEVPDFLVDATEFVMAVALQKTATLQSFELIALSKACDASGVAVAEAL